MPQARSSDSVQIVSLDRAEFIERLLRAARRLVAEHTEVEEVRLFGSIARGDHQGASDADILLVLGPGPADNPLDRLLEYLPHLELDRHVDVLTYTRAELAARLATGDRFMKDIYTESVLIWRREPAAVAGATPTTPE